MMTWYVLALLSSIALAGQFLVMQRLQRQLPISVYMAYLWFGVALVISLLLARPQWHAVWSHLLYFLVAGGASWAGMYAFNKALQYQGNAGYVDALSSIRLVLAYVASIFLFAAPLQLLQLLAVAGTAIGILIVSWPKRESAYQAKLAWIPWSLLSGAMFALLVVVARYMTSGGVDVYSATAGTTLVAGLLFAGQARGRLLVFPLKYLWAITALGILFGVVGNVALFASYSSAPNLAYSVAISNSRSILLYLFAVGVARDDKLSAAKFGGMILAFASIALLG